MFSWKRQGSKKPEITRSLEVQAKTRHTIIQTTFCWLEKVTLPAHAHKLGEIDTTLQVYMTKCMDTERGEYLGKFFIINLPQAMTEVSAG